MVFKQRNTKEKKMKPGIGDIVLYESNGKQYPAIIIEPKADGICALCIFKETTTQFLPVVYFSEHREPGCWSVKPEKVQKVVSIPVDKDFGVAKEEVRDMAAPKVSKKAVKKKK